MTRRENHKSGKGSGDENFPVASRLVAAKYRAPILAYYRFARSADDAADHATLAPHEKLRLLDSLEATLLGKSDDAADAIPLRHALAERGLAPRHALDLLVAFRRDVTQTRYATWDELMAYCRFSAAPVGRFVLDVHGETTATYASSDALCAALQIINHVQDCGKDYRNIDRVYMPLDLLAAEGATVEMLGADKATPQLARALKTIVAKTSALMGDATRLPSVVADRRLSMETAVIATLAQRILKLLATRDPLSQRVHLSKQSALVTSARAAMTQYFGHTFTSRNPASANAGGQR